MTTTLEKRKFPRTKARWPITIITNHCIIEGELRNITANGIFARCKEQLHENKIYRIFIRLPQNRCAAVKGKVIWSNLEGIDPDGAVSDMGFSFVELPEEDRFLLKHAVSAQHT